MYLIYLIFLMFFPFNAYSAELTIKTQSEGRFLPGCDVIIWKKAPFIEKSSPDYRVKTDRTGAGKIILEDGKYYIFAEKTGAPGYYFGFYGLNPMHLKDKQSINVSLVRYGKDHLKKLKKTGVSGRVYHSGVPVEGVGVNLYLDLNSDLKGPPYMLAVTDGQGRFHMDIEPGNYYVFFRKRMNSVFGPPEPGDYVGFFPVFPLKITGQGVDISAELLKISDKMQESLGVSNIYRITGVVLNSERLPLKGLYVGAYGKPDILGKPDYVSAPTDAQGRFRLYVKESGTYFIAVRDKLGDTPQPEEKVFSYGEVILENEGRSNEIEIVIPE